MIDIVKAYPHDFHSVLPLLEKFDNPYIGKGDWEKLFIGKWNTDEDYCGFMLKDADKIVGFHGLLFSTRVINNARAPFANMTSWIVEEEYRKYSLGLLMEILRMKEYTFTNLTPGAGIDNILEKSGFAVFEEKYAIIPPVAFSSKIDVQFNDDIPLEKLDATDLDLLSDHNIPGIVSAYCEFENQKTLIIGKRIYKKKLPFFRVNYVSNREMFKSMILPLANKLCLRSKSLALLVPSGLLSGAKIKASINVKLPHAMYFKSDRIDASSVDTLYSELMLLNV